MMLAYMKGHGPNYYHRYIRPLSPYVSKPNPYNVGTIHDGVAWKDTYVDGLVNALDLKYGEYFGVFIWTHPYRLFVNLDLLEETTGSREMPMDLAEWMEECRQIK